MPTLSTIHIYPLKSARGLSVDEIALDRFGPRGDRRWMLIDAANRFISQREIPDLARLDAHAHGEGLRLSMDGHTHEVIGPTELVKSVQVFSDSVPAQDAGDAVSAWLTERFERALRLVYMPDDAQRLVDPAYAKAGETVSFADGFPLLLLSAAAIDGLNERLSAPVTLDRFRPNFIVSDCEAHAEDGWRRVRIGAVEFTVAKPCSRCTVPAVHQQTGERRGEVLRELASYRRGADRKVYFGQNLLYAATGGVVRVGDTVAVLEAGAPGPG